jgi:hypothetical protein
MAEQEELENDNGFDNYIYDAEHNGCYELQLPYGVNRVFAEFKNNANLLLHGTMR